MRFLAEHEPPVTRVSYPLCPKVAFAMTGCYDAGLKSAIPMRSPRMSEVDTQDGEPMGLKVVLYTYGTVSDCL